MPLPDDLTELLRPVHSNPWPPARPPQWAWTWERACIRIAATTGLIAWVLLCARVIVWAIGIHG